MTTTDQKEIPSGHHAVVSAAFLQSCYPVPDTIPENTNWVFVKENGVYTFPGSSPTLFFLGKPETIFSEIPRVQYLGHRDSTPYYAAEVLCDPLIPGCTFHPNLREMYGVLSDEALAVAALAVRIIAFDRTTRFCGQCGSEMRQSRTERAKVCACCSLTVYPRISPAIIVLVRNGNRILLARSPRFPPDLFSIIAGFVEPGETIEEAVHREVREETGIEITNLRYFGSEPWPFPDSLMIGFVADYAGGDIMIDNNEIVSAGWFDRDHLPSLPSPMSISRALIDRWIAATDLENDGSAIR